MTTHLTDDPAYREHLIALAAMAERTISEDEATEQIMRLGLCHQLLADAGIVLGLTLGPTVFGDTRRDGQPKMQQTLVAEFPTDGRTPAALIHCVGDGRMTAAEQAIWFTEYLLLRGLL